MNPAIPFHLSTALRRVLFARVEACRTAIQLCARSLWVAFSCLLAPALQAQSYTVTGTPPNLTCTITANMHNFDVASALGNPTTPVNVVVTVNAGVIVGSSDDSSPAFTSGSLPPGSTVKIINKGRIQGSGGDGGDSNGGDGGDGGIAISVTIATTIDNALGEIWGGGGGGGGQGERVNSSGASISYAGSGGAGTVPGSGGDASAYGTGSAEGVTSELLTRILGLRKGSRVNCWVCGRGHE